MEIKILILPKFERGEMSGDAPGEAQFFYEHYLAGGESYPIPGCENPLYVRDGVGLILTGMGKVNAATTLTALLTDPRFDFHHTLFLSVGCAGSAVGYGVMGDVFVVSACVDYDLGHHADFREMENRDPDAVSWFHDSSFADGACFVLNPELTGKILGLTKAIPLKTTGKTRTFMQTAFPGEDWALRDPEVRPGTTVSSDNYWKGIHGHRNALKMNEVYHCPDPFAVTEMEDAALAHVLSRFGLLDRYAVLRASVNTDVFMLGQTPENLWLHASAADVTSEDSAEAGDIFPTAMENLFRVGERVIEETLLGRL